MNFYSVWLNNGMEYEDYTDMRYFIIASTEEEVMMIGAKLWDDQFKCSSYDVSADLMTRSDNEIPIVFKNL